MMRRNITFRNILLLFTLMALILAVWLADTSRKLSDEVEERFFDQYNRQQLLIANHTARGILDLFGTFKRALTLTAELFHSTPVTLESSRATEASLKAIYDTISDTPIIDLVLFDKDGTVVGIVPDEPGTLGHNYSWRGYYKWARDEGKPGKMYLSPFLKLQGGQNRGEMAIMVAEGIYDADGGFKGVVMITVNFDQLLRRHLLTVKVGEGGYAWLIDSANGSILLDPRGKVTGQTIEQAFLPRWPKLYELTRNSASGKEGLDWYEYEDPADSSKPVRKLVAYSPVRIENFLWTVGVCTPEEEVKKLFASYMGRQHAFFITVTVATVGVALLFLGILSIWNRLLVREVTTRTGALAEANEKLEKTFEELLGAKKLAAVGHLALGLVHEIRNPLSSIRMNMQMIRKRLPQEGPSSENFRIMEEEILRLNRLLGDVMIFARPAPLRLSPVKMPDLARRALILVGERVSAAAIEASSEWAEPFPEVVCDREQIMQVLLNLLLNSIQALENQPGTRNIQISGAVDGESVSVTVSDSGPGIPPGRLESLFDPFFTTKAQGGGLGLSIAKRIVQSHGGTLEADSGAATGAKFVLCLPIKGPEGQKERPI